MKHHSVVLEAESVKEAGSLIACLLMASPNFPVKVVLVGRDYDLCEKVLRRVIRCLGKEKAWLADYSVGPAIGFYRANGHQVQSFVSEYAGNAMSMMRDIIVCLKVPGKVRRQLFEKLTQERLHE